MNAAYMFQFLARPCCYIILTKIINKINHTYTVSKNCFWSFFSMFYTALITGGVWGGRGVSYPPTTSKLGTFLFVILCVPGSNWANFEQLPRKWSFGKILSNFQTPIYKWSKMRVWRFGSFSWSSILLAGT